MKRIAVLLLLAVTSSAWSSISGTIVSNGGSPVENALITTYRAETREDVCARIISGTMRQVLASATSGASGTFTIAPKAEGVFELHVERDGFAPRIARAAADETDLVINLESAQPRVGHVTA